MFFKERKDGKFELTNIADYNLPLLNEPMPPSFGQFTHRHTKAWSKKIASFDAYVFVTPGYDYGISGGLRGALDYLYLPGMEQQAGFMSYGDIGSVRAKARAGGTRSTR